MAKTIKFSEDTYLETIEAVNEALKPYGIEFKDDEQEHDGYCVCELKVDAENQLKQLRELVRKAPLGYYQGRLIKHRSSNEQDVVNWLVKLHELLGL